MSFQIISGTHSRHQKQQHHKPRIQQVLHGILILYLPKRPDHSRRHHTVIHKNHMVYDHEPHRDPADVIQIVSSHIFPTFALYFNSSITKMEWLLHRASIPFFMLSVKNHCISLIICCTDRIPSGITSLARIISGCNQFLPASGECRLVFRRHLRNTRAG